MVGGLQANVNGALGNGMSGSIDEIALFPGKVLSQEEINTQYAAVFPITRVYDGTTWADADKRVIG